jgi:hypothetical protein
MNFKTKKKGENMQNSKSASERSERAEIFRCLFIEKIKFQTGIMDKIMKICQLRRSEASEPKLLDRFRKK